MSKITYFKLYFKIRRFVIYAFRWQLSTPVYAVIIQLLSDCNSFIQTIVANAISACIFFFWIDKVIFSHIN